MASARYVSGGYDDPATYERLAEVLDEFDARRGTAGNRVFYLATPPRLFGPIADQPRQGRPQRRPDGDGFVRVGHREAVRMGRGQRPRPLRDLSTAFVEEPGLPHRPLPRQGDGAEPAGAALRQLDLRADLEPHLGRPRADHRRRDARRRTTRRLLRDAGRDARHRAEPRAAGAVALPHGAARRRSTPRRSATRRSSCCGRSGRWTTRRHRRPRRPRAVHPRRHPRATSWPATGRSPASTR